MRTIKQILIIALVLLLAANIATLIYQGTTDTGEAPVIFCPGGVLEVSASVSEAELLADVTATDGQDGDLSQHVIVASISKLISTDTAKVTYLVFDSDDNMASYVRRIRYTDYSKPQFQIRHPLVYSTGEEVELLSRLSAKDVVDGNISDQIRVSTLASTDNEELFDITIQVTNSMGDTAWLNLPVQRLEYNPLRPTIALTEYLIYIEKEAAFDPAQYLATLDSPNEDVSLDAVRIENYVDTSTPNTYRVYYTYDNGHGTGMAILTVVVQ